MMGKKAREFATHTAISVEALVPADHFYRHLEAKLDLSFVRDWARELYADRGRPGIDPVVFFKLQLVMFFEGIRSERKLVETASLHLAHRWYLGYALDEPLPDHSSLTRIRQRLGVDVFQRFFERVVDLCQEAGLVWGQELFVDATKVRASADLDTLVPRFAYEAKAHIADLFDDEATEATVATDPPSPEADLPTGIVRLPTEAAAGRPPVPNDPPWSLLEQRRLDPNRPAVEGYQRMSDWRVSPTDPDATPMQTKIGTALSRSVELSRIMGASERSARRATPAAHRLVPRRARGIGAPSARRHDRAPGPRPAANGPGRRRRRHRARRRPRPRPPPPRRSARRSSASWPRASPVLRTAPVPAARRG
jgi:transposase